MHPTAIAPLWCIEAPKSAKGHQTWLTRRWINVGSRSLVSWWGFLFVKRTEKIIRCFCVLSHFLNIKWLQCGNMLLFYQEPSSKHVWSTYVHQVNKPWLTDGSMAVCMLLPPTFPWLSPSPRIFQSYKAILDTKTTQAHLDMVLWVTGVWGIAWLSLFWAALNFSCGFLCSNVSRLQEIDGFALMQLGLLSLVLLANFLALTPNHVLKYHTLLLGIEPQYHSYWSSESKGI